MDVNSKLPESGANQNTQDTPSQDGSAAPRQYSAAGAAQPDPRKPVDPGDFSPVGTRVYGREWQRTIISGQRRPAGPQRSTDPAAPRNWAMPTQLAVDAPDRQERAIPVGGGCIYRPAVPGAPPQAAEFQDYWIEKRPAPEERLEQSAPDVSGTRKRGTEPPVPEGPAAADTGAAAQERPPAAGSADAVQETAAAPEVAEEQEAKPPAGSAAPAEDAALVEDASETLPVGEAPEPPSPEPVRPAPLSDAEVLARTAQKWKYKAPPPAAIMPEPTPDMVPDELEASGCRITGARVRGKKHKHEGTNCDDWFAMAAVDDIAIAAVADGAGSRRFSRVGARVSCETAVAHLRQVFTQLEQDIPKRLEIAEGLSAALDSAAFREAAGTLCSCVQDAVEQAILAVEKAWQERKDNAAYAIGDRPLQLADLACTLLVLVMVPTKTGEPLLISCQVGDGSIAAMDTTGPYPDRVRILGEADSGEYSGQTDFITSERFRNRAELQRRTRVSRSRNDLIMLMTDGVADDYHPNETRLTELYYDLVANEILDRETDITAAEAPDAELTLPEALAYPWVNNPDIEIPLNYADVIMDKTGLSHAGLWTKRDILARAAADLPDVRGSARKDRLATWLDNYVKRGSFDDRTLVLITLDGGTREH